MKQTPNLSSEFHPVPKPIAKGKKEPKLLKAGKKTRDWNDGRETLKKQFSAWGITECEIKLAGCTKDNFLGFAHTERRRHLTSEDVKNPNKVVLGCNPCHDFVDFEMGRKEGTELLESIIKKRQYERA